MTKETFYFSHDFNARNDDKIIEIRMKYDWYGYGVYFAIIEILREQDNYTYPSNAIAKLAYSLSIPLDKFEPIYKQFFDTGLFIEKGGVFYSESLMKRMEKVDKQRAKRVAAGRKGGNAKAMLKQCPSKRVASKVKESKVKESKVKESNKCYPLAQKLKEKIVERSSNAKITDSQLEKWSNTFRVMIEIDKRSYDQIDKLIDDIFSHEGNDGFSWGNNIKSADKLRLRLNEGKLDNLTPVDFNKRDKKESQQHTESTDNFNIDDYMINKV